MSTVVAVFAHPDDETFICGGTLAKLSAEGHRVVLVCATLGEMGRRMGIPPIATRESIGRLRQRELNEACEALGVARLVTLGIRDKWLEMCSQTEVARRVASIFEEETPSAIITFHDPLGGHPDHCAIGRIATEAYETYAFASPVPVGLFYVAWGESADTYKRFEQPVLGMISIDVHAHKAAKLRAFRAHRTQSQLDRGVWGSEKQGLSRMSNTEYFVHSQGMRLSRNGILFEGA